VQQSPMLHPTKDFFRRASPPRRRAWQRNKLLVVCGATQEQPALTVLCESVSHLHP